ncbi:MAG TPA: hypothetical protein VHZ29_10410 [Rhizomicrobium sp.]|nr:hypothetical protein [Rhizomicrobium sp.]
MTIELEFPGIELQSAANVADHASFYLEGYEVLVNRVMAARGKPEFLGQKPQVCRFCSKTKPEVTFRNLAHAVPELAGNGTLLTYYECDACNERFSAFEDDLGKMTLIERAAGRVLGKRGIPSARTSQKRSRIDASVRGFDIKQYEGDPIVSVDESAKTMTVRIAPQLFRRLGAFKALVKIALTVMPDSEIANVPEALRWLRATGLRTDQIDDGTRYRCIRTFTPGPAPLAAARAFLLKRKTRDVPGPMYVFVLAFGNLSFQIIVPCPQEDQHLIGTQVSLRTVPVFAFMDQVGVRGSTRHWVDDLSSDSQVNGSSSIVFHFDRLEDVAPSVESSDTSTQ